MRLITRRLWLVVGYLCIFGGLASAALPALLVVLTLIDAHAVSAQVVPLTAALAVVALGLVVVRVVPDE
jgi:hypothetical protein